MSYTAKNYMTPGGSELHIGGKLVFEGSGSFEGGIVENVPADETGTTESVQTTLNALLAALKAAGIMAPDTES